MKIAECSNCHEGIELDQESGVWLHQFIGSYHCLRKSVARPMRGTIRDEAMSGEVGE
jgi:hypothetical protein